MTYNLTSVRTRLMQKLEDDSFDLAIANQFINDAQQDTLNTRRFTFMEREEIVLTRVDENTFDGLPTDMQTPLTLRIYEPNENATLIPYIEYEDLDQMAPNPTIGGTGAPTYWYIFNGVPMVYPASDKVYTCRLRYIKSPVELVEDLDVPEIPESFSELLVLGAYKRALEFNDENDKSQIVQQQIDEQIEKLDERFKRQSSTPYIMRQPLRARRLGRY